jgi:hypothetical protein
VPRAREQEGVKLVVAGTLIGREHRIATIDFSFEHCRQADVNLGRGPGSVLTALCLIDQPMAGSARSTVTASPPAFLSGGSDSYHCRVDASTRPI